MENTFIDEISSNYSWITLTGMSGLGKSYWSKVLATKGYKRFCCDDMIEDRIVKLCKIPDKKEIDIGKWMGFPFEKEYRRNENIYLTFEIEVLSEIISYLQTADPSEKIVIDTTGSAPYSGEDIMNRLRELSCIVHLSVSQDHHIEMLEKYINKPRPVLWGDLYVKKSFETEKEALARSYEALLVYRETLYKKYAHHSIPYSAHRT
jgi:shikimate kinase